MMLSLKSDKPEAQYQRLLARFDIDHEAIDSDEQLEQHLEALCEDYDRLKRDYNQSKKDVARLENYLSNLSVYIDKIHQSLAWKLGCKVTSCLTLMLGRKLGNDYFKHAHMIIEKFEHWKLSRD